MINMFGKGTENKDIDDLTEDELNSRIGKLKAEARRLKDNGGGEKLVQCYSALARCNLALADKEVFPLLEDQYRTRAKMWRRACKQEGVVEESNLVDSLDEGDSGEKETELEGEGSEGADQFFDWSEPDVDFSDLGGEEKLKERLDELVLQPVEEPEFHEEYGIPVPVGILLEGPPGTGKTLTAKAIAGELDRKFLNLSAAELRDKFAGESESNVNRLFEQAKSNQPAIIFLDDVDSLLQSRLQANSSAGLEQLVGQFLRDMTMLQGEDVLVIATTNRASIMDDAAKRPGRFGYTFEIGMPDSEKRFKVLKKLLEDRPVATSDIDLRQISRLTQDYSCADLEQAVIEAARSAKNAGTVISQEHLENGVSETNPSIENPEDWS